MGRIIKKHMSPEIVTFRRPVETFNLKGTVSGEMLYLSPPTFTRVLKNYVLLETPIAQH